MEQPAFPLNPDYQIYSLSSHWGDHISFLGWTKDSPTQRIYGHKTPKPRDGDLIKANMSSGRKALFIIHDLECPGDPPDMFFANVSFVGYEGEIELPESLPSPSGGGGEGKAV